MNRKVFLLALCGVSLACGTQDLGDVSVEQMEAASALVAPKCDEDNVSTAPDSDPGVIAASVPAPMIAFIRAQGWNCMHRGWHAVRRFNFILSPIEKKFVVEKGWLTVDPATNLLINPGVAQEGGVGNGVEFLAMHRVMISMLREAVPQYKDTALAGWQTVSTTGTVDEPLPPNARAFDSFYVTALSRLSSNAGLSQFSSDDEFGAYIQTKNYPGRGQEYYFVNPDKSAGIHNYLHNRYNVPDLKNPAAAVRMSNFARNIENRVFWKLHGWLDGRWTAYRLSRGVNDTTDTTYQAAMTHACAHMGRGTWKATANGAGVCLPPVPGMPAHRHP